MLPFFLDPSTQPRAPEPVPISLKEVEALRATIMRLTKENEELHQKLCNTTSEKSKLEINIGKRDNEIDESEGTAFHEAWKIQRVKYGLDTLESELNIRNEELRRATKANKDWKSWWDKAFEQRKMIKEASKARIEHLYRQLH